MSTFICHQCQQEKEMQTSGGTGYARDNENNLICYACCGENDRKHLLSLKVGEKTVFYLANNEVTNWPGTLRISVPRIRTGRHNIAGKRYDTWFTFEGLKFHGVTYGDNTQIHHIKRVAKH